MISYNTYNEKYPKELCESNTELIEMILKETQEVIIIEDISDEPMIKSNYSQKEKGVDIEECELHTSVTVLTKKLLQALGEDVNIYVNCKPSKNVRFASFDIIEKIGEGSYGQVFKVKLLETGAVYAMKSISKDYIVGAGQKKYAKNECKVLKLMDNQFIVKMHYAFQTPHYLHFVIDFCDGGDLSMYIESRGVFDEEEAKFYIAELILAVEYLHSNNIIYRDMKPSNVLIGMFFT